MSFASQADLDLVRQMVDHLNAQQAQDVTALSGMRGDVGQAMTVANQAKQDFEDATNSSRRSWRKVSKT